MVISSPVIPSSSSLFCDVCNASLLVTPGTPWWQTYDWIKDHGHEDWVR